MAKSLMVLRDQFNKLAPKRLTDSDGTIGNAAHQATTSDHNPNSEGVVCALDITHDPAHGVDTYDIADQLLKTHDSRIKYIISNNRIVGDEDYARRNGVRPWTWNPYGGRNPHDHHFHVSVDKPDYDKENPWQFHLTEPRGVPQAAEPLLRLGSKGERVSYVRDILKLSTTSYFDQEMEAAVRGFQQSRNLFADGIVGPYTWRELLKSGWVAPVPLSPRPGPWASGKGSWYSQYRGKHVWVDRGDAPGSAALGVPDEAQGIAFYNHGTLGAWFEVRAPNGHVSIEQQTDIGPSPRTGRSIDISSAAAERFGYSPNDFPTDGVFEWRAAEVPVAVRGMQVAEQGVRYYQVRSLEVENRPLGP